MTLPILAASFALATFAMADNTASAGKDTTTKTATTAPAKDAMNMSDRTMSCSKPMDKPACTMHCGM